MWKTVISQRETETSTGQVCGPQCFPLQYLLLVSNNKTYSTHYQVAWCQINKGKNAVKGCRLLTPISRQLIYCVRWWEQWMVKNLDRSSFFFIYSGDRSRSSDRRGHTEIQARAREAGKKPGQVFVLTPSLIN